MPQEDPESLEQRHLSAQVERLRVESESLRARLDKIEGVLTRQRAVLFEMDFSRARPDAGQAGDLVVFAGAAEHTVERIARRVADEMRSASPTDGPLEFDVVVENPSGRDSVWRTSVSSTGTNSRVVVSARDVTTARSHLRDLQEKEALYHSLLDMLPEPVLFTDLHGRLLYINPAGVALLGAPDQATLLGTSIWSHVHRDDLRRMRDRSRQLLRGMDVEESHVRFVRSDGKVIHVQAHSVATQFEGRSAVLSTARDITDQSNAATTVRESREMLAKIFHASPAAMVITRLRDGQILDVNASWSELTGHEFSATDDVRLEDLDLWRDPTQGKEFLRRIRSDYQLMDVELELRRRNGEIRTVLCSSQQIQMAGEGAVMMVINDISARKQVETKLVEARDRAREMARIKATFLTNMTHEIRTPLTVILGFTTMLKQGVNPAYRRFVNVIERSGKRLLLTLDSILDLAQLEAGSVVVDRVPFRVHDAVESVVDAVEPLASDKGLTIDFQTLEQSAFAAGGHRIFTRIIHHLLDNAVKFTEAGAIKVRVSEEDEDVSVVVSDTGIGIRPEFIPHIFDEFSQESTGLERTHQGSGLGLAVSQRLAVAIGGRIDVESEKGKGSTFRLRVPRAAVAMSR